MNPNTLKNFLNVEKTVIYYDPKGKEIFTTRFLASDLPADVPHYPSLGYWMGNYLKKLREINTLKPDEHKLVDHNIKAS